MPNAIVSAAGGAMPAVTAFYEITPTTRRRIESAVESLLALLDELDGEEDREEEPDLEEPHDAEQPAFWCFDRAFDEPWEGFFARLEVKP